MNLCVFLYMYFYFEKILHSFIHSSFSIKKIFLVSAKKWCIQTEVSQGYVVTHLQSNLSEAIRLWLHSHLHQSIVKGIHFSFSQSEREDTESQEPEMKCLRMNGNSLVWYVNKWTSNSCCSIPLFINLCLIWNGMNYTVEARSIMSGSLFLGYLYWSQVHNACYRTK